MSNSTFAELGLAEPLRRALSAENYLVPTPIQAEAIPLLLAGPDMLGVAQTGTGKTAAFGLPLLQLLAANREVPAPRQVRALILSPTRELTIQINEALVRYGRHMGLRTAAIVGGANQNPQVKALARGVDILVATPGRLLDLMQQRHVALGKARFLVLDEADRMLDMGFIRDVRKIIATLPRERQSLLFSATMPTNVQGLAAEILKNPARVDIAPKTMTADRIDQHVVFVSAGDKRSLLATLLKRDAAMSRVIVFTRTKRGASRVAENLDASGIAAEAIHGNKSQSARQRALDKFRRGEARVLVATDVASRGIDVDGITHVINYELPADPLSYVHRIGRTARAGAEGIALSFCDGAEREALRDIEKHTRRPLAVLEGPNFPRSPADAKPGSPKPRRGGDNHRRPPSRNQKQGHGFKPPVAWAAGS